MIFLKEFCSETWQGRGIVPRILTLSTIWRWVVSFTPQPLYRQGKSPRYLQKEKN